MTIEEYADVLNVELVVRRCANQENRWMADFESCEIKDGVILSSSYGDGKSPDKAIDSYVEKIRGKRIVFHAMSTAKRREYEVPHNLTGRL